MSANSSLTERSTAQQGGSKPRSLEMNQSPGPTHALPPDMADVLYQCATTGQNVHVWFADDVPNDSVYISLRCPACARMHLVNRSGRTLMPPTPRFE